MMKNWSRNLVSAGVAMAIMPFTMVAYAQSAEQEADDKENLEVITINARRRDESIQEVPVTVNVISAADIQSKGLLSPTELFNQAPGIDFDGSQSGEPDGRAGGSLSIRGIQGPSGVGSKVTTFFDGMPMSGSQGIVSLYDVASVEIYRGAQSAVFGRSTFAGAINYLTKNPTDEFEGKVNTEFGQDGKWVVGATLSGPISENLGYYLNYTKDNYDGDEDWLTSDGVQLGASESEYFSTKLVWLATDDLTIDFRYSHVNTFDTPSASYYIDPDSASRQFLTDTPSPVNAKAYIGELNWTEYRDPNNIYARNHFSNNGGNNIDSPGTELTRDRYAVDLSWDVFDDYAIKLKGFYAEEDKLFWRDRDSSDLYNAMVPVFIEHWATDSGLEEKYLEAFFASENDDDGFTWHMGVSYYNYDYNSIVRVDQNANIIQSETAQNTTNTGVFFAMFYDLTDDINLSFEGRYQNDDVTNASIIDDVSRNSSTNSFLPRAAVHWSINPETNFYAQVSKGNNPAGSNLNNLLPNFNATADLVDARNGNTDISDKLTAFTDYEEEEIWTYEVGFKGSLLDHRLRYTTAVYYIDWSNALNVMTLNWFDGGPNHNGVPDAGYAFPVDYIIPETVNAGEIGGWGWEGDISYDITDNFETTIALSYVGLEYQNYCSVDAQDVYGITATGEVKGLPCIDVAGNQQAGVSDTTVAISALYHREFGKGMEWYARVDVNWYSKQYIDELNLGWIPSYSRVNLRAGIRSSTWDVEVYATNVTDDGTPLSVGVRADGYAASPTSFGPGTFSVNVQPSQGRLVGLRANFYF